MEEANSATHSYFSLSQSWRHIQVFWYENVAKVVPVLNTPHRQPINIVHRQAARQLNFNIFALVATQRL